MRFAHLVPETGADPTLVAERDGRFIPVSELGETYKTLQQLIEAGPSALKRVSDAVDALPATAGITVDSARLGPAVMSPPLVLAVGLNYDEHAAELSLDNDSGPVLFALFPTSLNGHGGTVEIPVRLSEEVDYEGELGVIIGRPAKDLSVEEALDYVFGYTAINDITARNIQFQEPQWSRCKSFDGFTPIGPVVVTADEIPDPQALHITTDVDGLRVQDSSTSFMIRTVAQLISSLSQSTTLMPGTVISTGSPGGAGRSRNPQLFLVEGTEVTVTIDKIGALTSHCTQV